LEPSGYFNGHIISESRINSDPILSPGEKGMIKAHLYLPNGRVISVFLKRRQYSTLVEEARQISFWQRIKYFFWDRKRKRHQ
jgi:hypothetical protein